MSVVINFKQIVMAKSTESLSFLSQF
jgi:hypothetical protein